MINYNCAMMIIYMFLFLQNFRMRSHRVTDDGDLIHLLLLFSFSSHLAHTLIVSMKGLIMAVVTMPLETSKNRMAFQTVDRTTG